MFNARPRRQSKGERAGYHDFVTQALDCASGTKRDTPDETRSRVGTRSEKGADHLWSFFERDIGSLTNIPLNEYS